jgi:tetratricopeptide (TPR) repeat protein
MELLFMDTEVGMRLAEKNSITGQAKSVMLLRAGDYFLFKQAYDQASEKYRLAVDELHRSPDPQPESSAEYLGHYAVALVKSGQHEEGFSTFDTAIDLIKNNKDIREFHHLIIHSGILLREADCYAFIGQLDKAKTVSEEATK